MDTQKEIERAKRIATERGLGGMSNNTKWSELFSHVADASGPLHIKFIDADEPVHCATVWMPADGYIEGPTLYPVHVIYVEWLKSTGAMDLVQVAKKIGLECSTENGVTTVYGYR